MRPGLRRIAVAVAGLTGVVALSGCSGVLGGGSDEASYAACLREAGLSVEDDVAELADPAAQRRLWTKPGALACAVSDLDPEEIGAQIVGDPELADRLLEDVDASLVADGDAEDLIKESDVPAGEIASAVTRYKREEGESGESVAVSIGVLMRLEDAITEDPYRDGIIQALLSDAVEGASTALGRPAPSDTTVEVLGAAVEETERLASERPDEPEGDEEDQALNASAEKNRAQALIAFPLYIQYDGTPKGFDDFVARQDDPIFETEPSQYVTRFIAEMENAEVPGLDPEEWEQMRLLIDTIDETRDEE